MAPSAAAGRLHKGSFDLAKLEPAIRGTPVVESHHARVFCAGPLEPNSGITLNNQNFMKPTIQINHNQHVSRSFPLTDYSFQTTADAKSSSSEVLPATKSPAFHRLSSEFFGAETSREYFAELLFFTLITGISAWPIISAIIAVTRLVRNY